MSSPDPTAATRLRLNHIGIAVSNIDDGSRIWEALGLPRTSIEDVTEQRTRVAFHPAGPAAVELLESLDPEAPVARFLAKRGPGVHHLCFEVDDLVAEMQRLSAAGFRFLSSEPQPGAHDTLVAFLHPKDCDGVLVELNQLPVVAQAAHRLGGREPIVNPAALRVIAGFEGQELSPELRDLLNLGIGGVILFSRNIESPEQCADLIADIRGAAGRPMLFAVDQEGGTVARLREPLTVWPDAAVFAQTQDPRLARQAGEALNSELKSLGFNLNFAPVLDVLTRPENPVIGPRAFGTHADPVSQLARAWAQGAAAAKMLSCGKHFPGHGDTLVDSHHALPVCALDRSTMEGVHLQPFARLLDQVDSWMTAHVVYPAYDRDWPATLSEEILQRLARKRMGYKGLIITDDLEMGALTDLGEPAELCSRAAEVGNDLLLVCRNADFVEHAVRACADDASQDAGWSRRDQALARRATALTRVGDDGPWSVDARRDVLGCRPHRALADQLMELAQRSDFDSPVAHM